MPATTTVLALPYPLATEPVSQGDDAIKALADRLEAIHAGAWTGYTATLSNFTASAQTARYKQVGKIVTVRFTCTLNAAPTGFMGVGLPVTASATALAANVGIVHASDSGTANHVGICVHNGSASTLSFIAAPSSPGIYNASTPFTWVSGDSLSFTHTYEAA